MSDDTTTFGTDTARYQPIGTYDPGAFEIINFEDPQRDQKHARNRRDGRPDGDYLWIYPNHALDVDAAHMVDTMRSVLGGDPELGYWFDYEDAGINEGQLHAGFAGIDSRRAYSGYYSGPHAIDHSQFTDRDWWNAAYPGNNDGSFPGYGALWTSSRPRPMRFWQYTSGGGLDRDVVVDDSWYAQLLHTPIPTPPIPPLEDDVNILVQDQTPAGNGTPPYVLFMEHGRPWKRAVPIDEVFGGLLGEEEFLGFVKTDGGRPFQAAIADINRVPDYPEAK